MSKGVLMIPKDKLIIPSNKSMKEVLKSFHKASPFKGTQLVEEVTCTSNLSESVAMLKINKSIANKNRNYMEKIVEVRRDAGDYRFTTFETLKTEQFLLNDPGIELRNCTDLLSKHIEASDTINDQIDNITLKVHSQSQKPTNEQQLDTLCSIDEDPIPHVMHRSELTASKNIWETNRTSPRYFNLIKKHQLLGKTHKKNTVKYLDIKCPLIKKLVITLYHEQEKIVELLHSMSISGYLHSPQLINSSQSTSEIAIVNPLLSQDILFSMSKTAVSMISFGFEYCVALTSSGSIASWGYGGSGCLGHGNYTSYTSPKLVKELKEEIVYIESGAYHVGAITSKGRICIKV
jgi:hypothetical protein